MAAIEDLAISKFNNNMEATVEMLWVNFFFTVFNVLDQKAKTIHDHSYMNF
jgi:hypothetical protein